MVAIARLKPAFEIPNMNLAKAMTPKAHQPRSKNPAAPKQSTDTSAVMKLNRKFVSPPVNFMRDVIANSPSNNPAVLAAAAKPDLVLLEPASLIEQHQRWIHAGPHPAVNRHDQRQTPECRVAQDDPAYVPHPERTPSCGPSRLV